jgi:hypothetical protein
MRTHILTLFDTFDREMRQTAPAHFGLRTALTLPLLPPPQKN